MALELAKHPRNRMFMTFGGGTATTLDAEALCQEALRLAEEEQSLKG